MKTRKGTLLILGQFGFLIALAVWPGQTTDSRGLLVASQILIAVALAVLVFAFFALRPSLTVRPEPKNGPFITHGIYRWIRHPMYTAVIALGVAMYLRHSSVATMALLLALMWVMYSKATYEDGFLARKWPQAKDYQKRTGAFFPKFWG